MREYTRVLILRTVGNFLVLSSLFLIAKTFYLPVKAEIKYYWDNLNNKKYIVSQDVPQKKGALAAAFQSSNIEILTPQDTNFGIIIPKVGANSRVIPNVDASEESIYLDALNKGVAHTLGTAFPGENGHIFLFAHSTDYFWNIGSYNAVFYLLYKLESGDEIDLFYKGQRYVYTVIGKQIVNPSQVEFITRKSNKEFLTLQTCWPPGTTLQRLLVFATRKAE